ncbi:MAG: Multi-copper polyphenol oxidoreductase, laccase [Gemmatimonadetes bacterium]|nr:Multi-copper polyphenol oxidoreductase, laccase [Gemmatimonadota bacterium]
MTQPLAIEAIDDFASFGITAFTTRRAAGTFGTAGQEPVAEVMGRWSALRELLRAAGASRLATAHQVHGDRVLVHDAGWEGWLRSEAADGHASLAPGTAMAVTIADCVPVFIAHPSGAAAAIHSGWRGTAARIVERGIDALTHRGLPASELRVHLGPAICGRCYEVSADVHLQLTGRDPGGPATVDLRALIAAQARGAGVRHLSISDRCTRCDNADFFSHRAGDAGRQLGVIATPLS